MTSDRPSRISEFKASRSRRCRASDASAGTPSCIAEPSTAWISCPRPRSSWQWTIRLPSRWSRPLPTSRAPEKSATARSSSSTSLRRCASAPARPASRQCEFFVSKQQHLAATTIYLFRRRTTVKRPLATSRVLTYLWSIALIAFAIIAAPDIARAQDTPAAEPAAAQAAPAEAAPAAAAPAEATAAPAAPKFDKGDISWMMTSTLLVILMTIPGLALFYGGMVRSKNVLSISMQVFLTFSLVSVLWCIYGYSVAFSNGNAFFGGFDRMFLAGMLDAAGNPTPAATFSKGVYLPEYVYAAFQMTFAAITPCLIVGAFAERMKFSAILLFMVLWFSFAYLPVAHMVWWWAGPDAYTDAAAAEAAGKTAGWLFQKGALDFAGGTVVHINAGIAGLV